MGSSSRSIIVDLVAKLLCIPSQSFPTKTPYGLGYWGVALGVLPSPSVPLVSFMRLLEWQRSTVAQQPLMKH